MKAINENEIWKDVPMDIYRDLYEVSNKGRIRSKQRVIVRTNRFNTKYKQSVGGNIISTRTNGTDPHLYTTLQYRNPKTGRVTNKTVYPHKLVAMAFVPKPNAKFDKVSFKDRDPQNIQPENLFWTDQSYLSKRNMMEHPENRNKLGNYQRRSAIPSDKTKEKVFELYQEGHTVYEIGIMVGKSESWGYSHVDNIVDDVKRNRKNKTKSNEQIN